MMLCEKSFFYCINRSQEQKNNRNVLISLINIARSENRHKCHIFMNDMAQNVRRFVRTDQLRKKIY